ncbi:hypothetical protein NHX12_007458 [Muraenolepis orangiensis]|uniref:MBD domain-containing protein n=1 Tax=Muraenolepis orangiensis TaxID=630683 RepID=A0A9Q0ID15_9TELE|nr:hypothetical protein NHX12_007458 [Muraenolepis orangiensis]
MDRTVTYGGGGGGGHCPAGRPPAQVPIGWQRRIHHGGVIYISPSGSVLACLEQAKRYLQTDGTCKCGLECPLILHKVFNFDPGAAATQRTAEDVMADSAVTKLCIHKRKIIAVATLHRRLGSQISSGCHIGPRKDLRNGLSNSITLDDTDPYKLPISGPQHYAHKGTLSSPPQRDAYAHRSRSRPGAGDHTRSPYRSNHHGGLLGPPPTAVCGSRHYGDGTPFLRSPESAALGFHGSLSPVSGPVNGERFGPLSPPSVMVHAPPPSSQLSCALAGRTGVPSSPLMNTKSPNRQRSPCGFPQNAEYPHKSPSSSHQQQHPIPQHTPYVVQKRCMSSSEKDPLGILDPIPSLSDFHDQAVPTPSRLLQLNNQPQGPISSPKTSVPLHHMAESVIQPLVAMNTASSLLSAAAKAQLVHQNNLGGSSGHPGLVGGGGRQPYSDGCGALDPQYLCGSGVPLSEGQSGRAALRDKLMSQQRGAMRKRKAPGEVDGDMSFHMNVQHGPGPHGYPEPTKRLIQQEVATGDASMAPLVQPIHHQLGAQNGLSHACQPPGKPLFFEESVPSMSNMQNAQGPLRLQSRDMAGYRNFSEDCRDARGEPLDMEQFARQAADFLQCPDSLSCCDSNQHPCAPGSINGLLRTFKVAERIPHPAGMGTDQLQGVGLPDAMFFQAGQQELAVAQGRHHRTEANPTGQQVRAGPRGEAASSVIVRNCAFSAAQAAAPPELSRSVIHGPPRSYPEEPVQRLARARRTPAKLKLSVTSAPEASLRFGHGAQTGQWSADANGGTPHGLCQKERSLLQAQAQGVNGNGFYTEFLARHAFPTPQEQSPSRLNGNHPRNGLLGQVRSGGHAPGSVIRSPEHCPASDGRQAYFPKRSSGYLNGLLSGNYGGRDEGNLNGTFVLNIADGQVSEERLGAVSLHHPGRPLAHRQPTQPGGDLLWAGAPSFHPWPSKMKMEGPAYLCSVGEMMQSKVVLDGVQQAPKAKKRKIFR